MGEKIFGEIKTTEDLNELAKNLRKTQEFDEIRLLCSENGISDEVAEEFIKGNRIHIAEGGSQEKRVARQSPTRDAVRSTMKGDIGTETATHRIKEGMLLSVHSDPEEVYTIEDVREKLRAELKIYRDGDSKYVIEKLIALCEKDKDLLKAIMLPHKSYDKAFQYFYEQSRNVGYKMPHGNMVYLDNDRAVELSVEYFKRDDAAEKKKEQHKKKSQSPNTSRPVRKEEKKTKPEAEVKKPVKPKTEVKKKNSDMDGQMSLFDF